MLLPFLALAWIAGLTAVAAWGSPWWVPGAWFVGLAPIAYLARGRPGAAAAVAAGITAATAAALMAWQGGIPPATSPLEALAGEEVTLTGVVASEADPGLRTQGYRVEGITVETPVALDLPSAAVLVTVGQFTTWLPGDVVRLRGRVEQAPDDLDGFDYRAYLRSRGIAATMVFPDYEVIRRGDALDLRRASTALQAAFERSVRRALPEPEASLAAGIAIGRDDGLPPEVVEQFRRSGLAHLTAVSGSNVSLLTALVFLAVTPLVGRRWALVPAVAVLAVYVLAAGLAPTVVRSTLMAWTFLLGAWLGRPQSGLAALGLAAIAMTAIDPGLARDVGFQLSLSATAGLIVFGPWVEAGLTAALARLRMAGVVGRMPVTVLAYTSAATIATLPIVASTFGRVSIAGLWANLLAGPVFVVAFPASIVTGAAGWVHPELGRVAGILGFYPLRFILDLAEVASRTPYASIETAEVNSTWVAAWFAVYVAAGWSAYRRFPPERPWRGAGRRDRVVRRGVGALAAGACVGWVGAVSLAPVGGPGLLEVVALDVGQGDATLVRTPAGTTVLIDGGPSDLALARELGAALPHWQRAIDLVIASHPDDDHLAGLAGLAARMEAGEMAGSGLGRDTEAARLLRQRAGLPVTLAAGDSFTVDEVRFTVLWPPDGATAGMSRNNLSLVIRVEYGGTSMLLTGDIERGAQAALVEGGAPLRSDVLKVPHHGAATSDEAFFAAVQAQAAVVSVGSGNRFGHPADETIAALGGTRILRTDEDGRIRLRSDGRTWSVKTER